jgi:hypothetical protein
MTDLVLALAPTLRERLEAVALKMDRSVEDCVQLALTEFVDSWEDYVRTVADLEKGDEQRPVLRAVND